MTTDPNPFSTGADLKGLIDTVSSVIGGQPQLPDTFDQHVDAAAEEIGKIEGPHVQGDITKILQKHFNAGSNGEPQTTDFQKSFDNKVQQKVTQNRRADNWKDH